MAKGSREKWGGLEWSGAKETEEKWSEVELSGVQ